MYMVITSDRQVLDFNISSRLEAMELAFEYERDFGKSCLIIEQKEEV